ncbi:thiamine pyrophosphokinase-related protein [Apiosordaria backusii]|uniref:Thiamine pyrophosphokinase-related protein n=1 Tax=Apiosordaria backusii TaxID=314023 RepID=A0AA40DHL6_9PEZI|nr:thiamine pyrophosphokinase-related protein [Apiosordaria backusii]
MSTTPRSTDRKSFLEIVNACDNFPVPQQGLQKYIDSIDSFYHFVIPSVNQPIGLVVPSVATAFRGLQDWKLDESSTPKTLALVAGNDDVSRTAVVEKALHKFRDEKTFSILSRWRNELKPVYGPGGGLLFKLDRAAAPILGVVSYGIHLTAFTRINDGQIKIWVQKRSQSTAFYPGLLDNTVASSSIPDGQLPVEAAIREAGEEASLPEDLVRSKIKSCGTLTYMHLRDSLAIGEVGLLQPQVEYLFELELPDGVEPKPCDHEVEWFKLLEVVDLKRSISQDKVKPGYAVVALDFLIRHGLLNDQNEPDFVEITTRLHRTLELPVG